MDFVEIDESNLRTKTILLIRLLGQVGLQACGQIEFRNEGLKTCLMGMATCAFTG